MSRELNERRWGFNGKGEDGQGRETRLYSYTLEEERPRLGKRRGRETTSWMIQREESPRGATSCTSLSLLLLPHRPPQLTHRYYSAPP